VQRDLLREYRFLLTENGIDIAFPQVVINQAEKKEFEVSSSKKNQAQKFVDEQKELSDGLEEQQT
jgi:small-conductance mechanosensitive channel